SRSRAGRDHGVAGLGKHSDGAASVSHCARGWERRFLRARRRRIPFRAPRPTGDQPRRRSIQAESRGQFLFRERYPTSLEKSRALRNLGAVGEYAANFLGGTMRLRRSLTVLFLLSILIFTIFTGSCTKKTPTLNLLVWEGYADPSFVKAFEEQNHCKVSASYMGSSDELMAKLRGGSAGNYDVISPSSDVAASIAAGGLAAPLDLTKIPSYGQLSPQLTSLPLVRVKGQVYGVPFMWGPDPMIYDTTVFAQAPDSWNVLWDPKYRGKISVWDDLSTVYMAAQVLGYEKGDPSQLYNLSDDQLEAVKKKLLELKPNIRKMWSTGGELTNLFQNHEVVAAMGWPLMTNQLR